MKEGKFSLTEMMEREVLPHQKPNWSGAIAVMVLIVLMIFLLFSFL